MGWYVKEMAHRFSFANLLKPIAGKPMKQANSGTRKARAPLNGAFKSTSHSIRSISEAILRKLAT